jgi:hypothetical protein
MVDCYKINIIIIGYILKLFFLCKILDYSNILKKRYDQLNELTKIKFNIFAKKEGKTSQIHIKILWSYMIYIWLKIKRITKTFSSW